jgi:antitoxin component of MazEF toxin-antitoxin module
LNLELLFVIRLEVAPELDKAAIESQAKELYERDRQLLEAQYQALLQAKDGQITVYQEWLNSERQRNTDLTGIVKTMADKETSKVTQHFNAPVTAVAGNVEGDQIIYSPEQRQTLAEAAAEIQELLDQLSQTYPTNTTTGKMQLAAEAIAQIESNPTLMQRVLSAIQAGGTAALEQFLNHPAASFVIGAMEDWEQTKEN